MRSESWTFIWQPKVRMHAVFVGSESVGPGGRWGFSVSFMGGPSMFSLILFLRLVDQALYGDLPGAQLQFDPLELEVARLRGPPKYSLDLGPFPLTKHEHRPFAPLSPSPLLLYTTTAPPPVPPAYSRYRANRSYLATPDPLHRSPRYL